MHRGTLFEKAQLLRNNGKFDQAIQTYSYIVSDETADSQLIADAQHMIGVTYKQAKEFEKAESSLKIAQQLFEKQRATERVGMVLRDRGDVAFHQKKYDLAKRLLEESLSHLHSQDMFGHRGMSTVKLGVVIAAQGDFVSGEKMVHEGISLIEQSPDLFFLSNGWYHLGGIQKEYGQKEDAQRSFHTSLDILNQISREDEYMSRRQQIKQALQELAG